MLKYPIKIYITSFNRFQFTQKVVAAIWERTDPPFEIHILDNGSEPEVVRGLIGMFEGKLIHSVLFHSQNTGCLWGKIVFHAMTPDSDDFAIITDNDFIPCVGWLPALLGIMERNKDLALLTLDYLPRWPLQPVEDRGEYILTKAVGNTFKLCRRQAVEMVIRDIPQRLGAYGDDGMLCDLLIRSGWDVGYAKGRFCFNLEMTADNWGYTPEQVKQDPRKAGYGQQVRYVPKNWDTLEPPDELI